MFTENHLLSGKKSEIFMEGASASVKHGTPFNISIISSQLGGAAGAELLFSSGASSVTAASEPPSVPQASSAVEALLGAAASG